MFFPLSTSPLQSRALPHELLRDISDDDPTPLEHRRKFISAIWDTANELRSNEAADLEGLGKRNDHSHRMSTLPCLKCSSWRLFSYQWWKRQPSSAEGSLCTGHYVEWILNCSNQHSPQPYEIEFFFLIVPISYRWRNLRLRKAGCGLPWWLHGKESACQWRRQIWSLVW